MPVTKRKFEELTGVKPEVVLGSDWKISLNHMDESEIIVDWGEDDLLDDN